MKKKMEAPIYWGDRFYYFVRVDEREAKSMEEMQSYTDLTYRNTKQRRKEEEKQRRTSCDF